MDRSDTGRQMDPLGMNDQEVLHDPRTTSNSIQLCLRSLQDLMQSLPPSASEVSCLYTYSYCLVICVSFSFTRQVRRQRTPSRRLAR